MSLLTWEVDSAVTAGAIDVAKKGSDDEDLPLATDS